MKPNLNRRFALLAATGGAVFAAGATDASAAVQCSATNGVLDVTITQVGNTTASISRTPLGQQPSYVLVNGVPCDKTTLAAAKKIGISDVSGGRSEEPPSELQ